MQHSSTTINKFALLLNVQEDEVSRVWILWIFSFFLGIAVVCYETSAYALFLANYEVETLPFVYIGAAILVIIIGAVYSYFEDRLKFSHLMLATLVALSFGVLSLRLLTVLASGQWMFLTVLLFAETLTVLTGFLGKLHRQKTRFGKSGL